MCKSLRYITIQIRIAIDQSDCSSLIRSFNLDVFPLTLTRAVRGVWVNLRHLRLSLTRIAELNTPILIYDII